MFGRKKNNKHVRIAEKTGYKKQSVYNYRSSPSSNSANLSRGGSSQQKRSYEWWIKRTPYIFCGVALLIALIYSMIVSTHARLDIVDGQTYLRDSSEYQNSIDKRLKSSPFNRLKFTVNTEKIADQIEAEFPELQQVVVSIPLFSNRPVVEFRLATPAALVETSSGTYVVDDSGRVLFDIRDKSSNVSASELPLIVDNTNSNAVTGKPILGSSQVVYVREIYLQAKEKDLKVLSVKLSPGGQQLEVKFSGSEYFVKFSLQEDARQSMGAFFAVKEKLAEEGNTPDKYIDVRVPEKVFVN